MTDEGKKLKAARLAAGIKQKDLALSLGCTQQNIYRLENGLNPMKYSSMVRLSHALGVKPGEIWSEDELTAACDREYGNKMQPQLEALQAVAERLQQGFDDRLLDLFHKLSVRGHGEALLALARLVDAETMRNEKPGESETEKIQAFLDGKN